MYLDKQHILYKRASEIHSFRLPSWRELPDEYMMRKKMLDYIDDVLEPLFPERSVLTGTMVQNYIKWHLVPNPLNRKYNRIHIAHFIVLSLLKEIITIQNIREGILLQTKWLDLSEAYTRFSRHMEDALRRASGFLLGEVSQEKEIEIEGLKAPLETLNLAYVCEALAFKFMAEIFIKEEGLLGSLASGKKPLIVKDF